MTLSETKIQNVRFPTVPAPGTSVHIGRSSLFAMVRSCDFGGPPFKTITEARSEGSIELKLVRKPPKVSRGYGGVALAAAGPSSQIFEELCSGINTFGSATPPQIGSGLGEAKFPQVSLSQAPKVVQNDPRGNQN